MEIFISIDGVIRNTIQKLDYHYKDAFFDSELEDDSFEYGITEPIENNNLFASYKFQSREEFEYFLFIEYPIEIFGHAGLSYSTTFSDLNNIIYNNKDHNITLIGLDELGKAKPATLFFLSKNGFLGNNIKFANSSDIDELWTKCDMWITDNHDVVKSCPENKIVYKFNTVYNQYFTNSLEITKLTEIKELCSNYSENNTTSNSNQLLNDAKQETP
jgi:hypothetical protein